MPGGRSKGKTPGRIARALSGGLALVWLFALPTTLPAAEVQHWRFQTSVYTRHFDPRPYHVNRQRLLSFEMWLQNDWHTGMALFDNSFGQPSQYLYLGRIVPLGTENRWYARITGGLMHGYKGSYEDKIPLNGLGIAPVIVPSLGVRHNRLFAEFQLLGASAGMITTGLTF